MTDQTLTHSEATGQAHIVDVGGKSETARVARAAGSIYMKPETLTLIQSGSAIKGDVLGIARIAAIQAAKRTGELIPLCHPIALTRVTADFDIDVGLSLSLLSAVATLALFGGLLWGLSRNWPLHLDATPLVIPGFMFWVALAFAILSTSITHLVERRLVPINFDRLRYETDFRYGLMRFRDNVESAVLSQGAPAERHGSLGRFQQVVRNFWQLIRAQRRLNLTTNSIGQVNEIMPLLLAAPFYFAHLITLGAIAQTRIAYGQVAAALTWFVNAYQEIARWRAGIERLTTFAEMMDATEREIAGAGVHMAPESQTTGRLLADWFQSIGLKIDYEAMDDATMGDKMYETDKAGDSFTAPFASLEPLLVDYLQKNLRVKLKGGKTYNFTSDSADALLVFQKTVEAARARL